MTLKRVLCSLVSCVFAVFLAGCGGGDGTPGQQGGQAAPGQPPEKTILTIDAGSLAPVEFKLPPLDEQRVEIGQPKGWYPRSRSNEYVVCFEISRKARYPLLTVTAEDCDTTFNISDIPGAEAFAKQTSDAFAAQGVTLEKKVTPLKLGNNWGIVYMKRAKAGNNIVDLMYFQTVVDGRKYTYEMKMLTGQFDKCKEALFAVAGTSKFLHPTPAPAPEDTPDAPAEDGADAPAEDAAETPPATS